MPPISLITQEPLEVQKEQEYFPFLFLHGYEVYAGGCLSPLSRAVCNTAIKLLQMNGDLRVIILGGWHLKEVSPHITIAHVMQTNLTNAGIDPERIITKSRFATLDGVMPPRDTWEELLLFLQILARLGVSPKAPMQSIAWDFHIPRLKKMHKTFGLRDTDIIPAVPKPYEGLRKRKWMERAARIVRYFDPRGEGIICHKTRLDRTLNADLKPLIP